VKALTQICLFGWFLASCAGGPNVRNILKKAAGAEPTEFGAYAREVANLGPGVRPELIRTLQDPDSQIALSAAAALSMQPEKFKDVDVPAFILNHTKAQSLAAALLLDGLYTDEPSQAQRILTEELHRSTLDRAIVRELCRLMPGEVVAEIRKGKVPNSTLQHIKNYALDFPNASLTNALRGR
jgi:hypothetical protein